MGPLSTTSAPPIIRLAHALAFGAFLHHIGSPVDRHLCSQGLPLCNDNPDSLVPLRRAWAFFDAAAQAEDPTIGWHAGKYVGDHNLNHNFLQKLVTAPTLYQALKRLIRMVSAEASHLELGILERPDDILFFTHYSTLKDWPGYASSQAYQLEVYLDLMRQFLGRHWAPAEIGIESPIVPTVVEEHFHGCRVLTSQRVGYIAVPRTCLHVASRLVAREQESELLVLTEKFDYGETLRALIKTYLADGYPAARTMATLMDTSVRTMARRLSESGLTYRALVDQVRFDSAKGLLLDSGAPIRDVGRSVGFEHPANFTRMFRRMAGLSPRALRQANQRVGR